MRGEFEAGLSLGGARCASQRKVHDGLSLTGTTRFGGTSYEVGGQAF